MKKWWLLFISIFLVLFFSNNVFADITINGYVKDSQDSSIANVKVEAINAKSDGGCPIGPPAKNSFTTASNGYYSFTFLSISGLCDYVLVTASKSGCTFSPTEYRSKFTGNDINKNFIGSCLLCVPNCINKQCGSDGCGGTCPPGCPSNQPSNQICNYVTGQCVSSQEGLSEIQLIACETAENNNNCDKLQNISLVTKEQCCSYLNLCCSSNNIISKQEFLSVLMSVIKNYFINPSNAKLNLNEIKDLVVAYLSVPKDTKTIDLSSIGSFSKEKLIDIYNKAKGTTSSTFNYKIMNSQTDQTKKSVYNIGDSITNYWSNLPQYAYSSSSNCKVYFWYYNVIPDDQQFYVPCGDSGLGTYNQVKYDTGTLTSEHCFGKTGIVTNTIQMIIKDNQNNVLAQSNSDSYTINCPTTTPNPIPTDAEILPWNWGSDGQLHVIYGIVGQKKTYIFRVPSGTKVAGGSFYAYLPDSTFNVAFTCVPGYKWMGYDHWTGQISYSGDFGIGLTPETMTPTPTDGFVPPGDYMVEITWIGSGPILITTARTPTTQTCSAAGGSCKTQACNTYTNCASLSTGTCTSDLNCCSGSCENPVTPTGIPLPLNDRINPTIPGGTERVYIFNVESNDKVYLRFDFTALTNEALAYIIVTMPDGTEFSGRVEGTSIGAGFALRSKKYYWPQYANINSDYIPSGYYIIRIRAVNTSYLVIRTVLD